MTAVKKFVLLFILPLALVSCITSERSKKQASYHYQMGLSFLGENNITRALVEFTEAEKITPNDPLLLNYLGLTYFYKKKYELAEQKFLKALKLKPKFSEVRNHLGVTYLEMKRWDDAVHQFQLVADDLFYQHPEVAVVNKGLAYYGKGDYGKALSVLQGAVADYPRLPQAHVNLARVHLAMDNTLSAIAALKTALQISPDYADAYYNLALAYVKLKDNAAAAAAFRQVVRIIPDSEKAQIARDYLERLK